MATVMLSNLTSQTGCLAKNFLLLVVGELGAKLFGFVAFAYMARVLGPKEFGQLEFALAVIFFLTLLVDCGLSAYGAREIAKDEVAIKRYTLHIIVLRCMLAAAAFVLLAIGVAVSHKPWSVQKLLLL